MKRSSTSSNVGESCEKQPVAKRSWGLGSLLHGLAGYVRPKNSNAKEKWTWNVINRETETSSRVSHDSKATVYTRPPVNERVPDINEPVHGEVNFGHSVTNETSTCVHKYESALSRSSTFSYTQSSAEAGDQQQRTPLLPRFKRNSRNSALDCSEADTSMVLPSSCLRRRQSCYSHYSDVGVLPTVKLIQSGTRPVLGEHNSRMVGADTVRVRVAPPDPIRTTNMSNDASEHGAIKPTSVHDTLSVVQALREKRKRACADEEKTVSCDQQSSKKRRADTAEAETSASSGGEGRERSSCSAAVAPAETADAADEQDRASTSSMTTPGTPHSALLGVRNAIDASYVSCRRHLSRRSSLASGRDGRVSRDSIVLRSVSRRSSICSQLQPHEDDRVTITDSVAASVPSSGRNTPAQLSDVSGAEAHEERRQLRRRPALYVRDSSSRRRLTPLPDEVATDSNKAVRRNYSLTAKDLEADRWKNMERARMLQMASTGDSAVGQVPVSDTAEIFRSRISTASLQISTAASLLNTQQSTVASSARTLAESVSPTTTSVTAQQSVTCSSLEQPVVATSLKSVQVECGGGDSGHITRDRAAAQTTSVSLLPGGRGDTDKPVNDDSAPRSSVSSTSQMVPFVSPSPAVVTCSSVCSASSEGVTQPLAASSSLLPVSSPAHEGPHSMKTVTENIIPLSSSLVAPSAVSLVSMLNVSSSLNVSSVTSFAPTAGFTPMFGNISQTVSSNSSSLSGAPQQLSLQIASTTSTATQQPRAQPTASVSSNPLSFGSFGNQPSFSFSASTSNQSAVTAPAVIPLASRSAAAVTLPLSTQSASGAFNLSFKAAATTALTGSSGQNSSKDQNTSFQFGSFPVQSAFSSSTSSCSSSVSSVAGFTPSAVPFGNSQQPTFRPVFGNPDSQQAASGFGAFSKNSAAPSFNSQLIATTVVQTSSSNIFQTSGNQPTSNSMGAFPGVSSGANPFVSSGFQSGSAIFGSSVSKSDTQTTSSSFGGFATVSAAGPFGSAIAPAASNVFGRSVPKGDTQTASNSFGAFSAGAAFGSSNPQTGSSIFNSSSVPKTNSQPSSGSFGGFTGSAPAFGNPSIQQGSTGFGVISGPVFNGMSSTTSAAQSSLPNGFHKSTASASPFAFSGKSDQTQSGTANPFVFGQSTNTVNGLPMSTPVPNFGSSTPASTFTFGNSGNQAAAKSPFAFGMNSGSVPSFGTTGIGIPPNNSPFLSPSPAAGAGVPSFSIGSGPKSGTPSGRRTGHHSRLRGARR